MVKCKCYYLCLFEYRVMMFISCLNNGLNFFIYLCIVVYKIINLRNKFVKKRGLNFSFSIEGYDLFVFILIIIQVFVVVIFISDSNIGVICWVNYYINDQVKLGEMGVIIVFNFLLWRVYVCVI